MEKEPETPKDFEDDWDRKSVEFTGDMDMTPLDQEAIHMHEIFKSLLKAGFSERQATNLVGVLAYDAMADATSYQLIHDDDEEVEPNEGDFSG